MAAADLRLLDEGAARTTLGAVAFAPPGVAGIAEDDGCLSADLGIATGFDDVEAAGPVGGLIARETALSFLSLDGGFCAGLAASSRFFVLSSSVC